MGDSLERVAELLETLLKVGEDCTSLSPHHSGPAARECPVFFLLHSEKLMVNLTLLRWWRSSSVEHFLRILTYNDIFILTSSLSSIQAKRWQVIF